ncbi:glutaredoxin domain-containing cysteine-rich protein CG12206-like [Centruroides vittatus]|uniref:glutaredoxin domain-containing cysteine-rich protein CG12206-like n=1 Tax=Centruroides vittatus TaxID=120091 RepID=UPI00350F4390
MWDKSDHTSTGGVSVIVNGSSVRLEEETNASVNWSNNTLPSNKSRQSEETVDDGSLFRVIRVFGGGSMERQKPVKTTINVTFGGQTATNGKTDEERSSSGASSGPASDCEDDYVKPNVVVKPNVCQLVISPYGQKEEKSQDDVCKEKWQMKFHIKELDSNRNDAEEVDTRAEAIVSGQGSVRGLKNRVRASIVSLLEHQGSKRNYDKEEEGRIVFYTTTMGIVRQTYEQCRRVKKILETLLIRFEERDVFMNRDFQFELKERLGINHVLVPHVFMEGRLLGNADVLEQLNETGELRQILRPYKRTSFTGTCTKCGGYKYLLCPYCGGSKKSCNHRHHFPTDQISLRCTSCDESGLIRCDQCINGEG